MKRPGKYIGILLWLVLVLQGFQTLIIAAYGNVEIAFLNLVNGSHVVFNSGYMKIADNYSKMFTITDVTNN